MPLAEGGVDPDPACVDEKRELLELVFEGEVTDSEFREVVDRYLREPFSALPLGLFDLSEGAATNVAAETVRDVARRVSLQVDSRLERGKLAIVAPRDLGFGLTRMYEMLRGDSPVEVRVFRKYDEAEAWLGLRKDALPRIPAGF